MVLFLDKQYFGDASEKEFIDIKEFAYIPLDDLEEYENDKNVCEYRCIFSKPPIPFNELTKEDKTMYTENIKKHGIPWDAGEIDYSEFLIELDSRMDFFQYFIVYDNLKDYCLSEASPYIGGAFDIINLAELGCPPLNEIDETPTFQHPEKHPECIKYECAMENVQKMKKWFLKNFPEKNMREILIHLQDLRDRRHHDRYMAYQKQKKLNETLNV